MPQTATKPGSNAEPVRNRVHHVAPDITEDLERHHLANALREGVGTMRRLARQWQYMRPNPGELEVVSLGGDISADDSPAQYEGLGAPVTKGGSYTVYDLRVERSCMPNPWAQTIRDTARLPFRSRITMEGWDDLLQGKEERDEDGEFKSAVAGWIADLDGEGRSLDEWAAEAFEDALFDGVVFAFVDNDPRSFQSAEDRRLAGGRPWVSKLRRCDVRRLTLERGEDGVPRVAQVVFRQDVREQDYSDPDDWKDEVREAYKAVTAGRVVTDPESGKTLRVPVTAQVYLIDKDGNPFEDLSRRTEIKPDDPTDVLTEVPIVPLYGRRTGPYRGESPYLDTADLQVAIWNQTSELLNKARETSLAYLHESGVASDQDSKVVKSDSRNLRYRWSSEPQAKLTFVEQSGESLAALKSLIEWLIDQVQEAHHQLRSDRPTAPVTAREITLEGVHASSALEMMVIFHEAGWKKILDLMALLGGQKTRGVVSIPHDFGLPSSGMDRNHRLFSLELMTAKNYWGEALRAGDVDEAKFDLDAEIELERERRSLAEKSAASELSARLGLDGEEEEEEEPEEPPEGEDGDSEPPPAPRRPPRRAAREGNSAGAS